MSKEVINNEALLAQIRQNKASRDSAISNLYYDEKLRAYFLKMMRSINSESDEFDSIFNLALMQFVTTVVKRPEFTLKMEYFTYITVIGRNAFIKFLKQKNLTVSSDYYENQWKTDAEAEAMIIDYEQKEIIFDLLGKLGKNCREVLLLWSNGYSMTEIAKQLNYKSEGMARKI